MWKKVGKGIDIEYFLFDDNNVKLAHIFKGGHKDYPWSWYLQTDKFDYLPKHMRHGDSLTLKSAKQEVDRIVKKGK